jgi:hypothetical protein
VLVVSFIPDVAPAMSSAFSWPLATVFMVMHVAAWVPCVTILTKLSEWTRIGAALERSAGNLTKGEAFAVVGGTGDNEPPG